MSAYGERATVQYRITPSKEVAPKAGDVLHAKGLTNWHAVVLKILETLPPNEDGTVDIKMNVERWAIGRENKPCPICGATWMAKGKDPVQSGGPLGTQRAVGHAEGGRHRHDSTDLPLSDSFS